jgi:hypothetical protein
MAEKETKLPIGNDSLLMSYDDQAMKRCFKTKFDFFLLEWTV